MLCWLSEQALDRQWIHPAASSAKDFCRGLIVGLLGARSDCSIAIMPCPEKEMNDLPSPLLIHFADTLDLLADQKKRGGYKASHRECVPSLGLVLPGEICVAGGRGQTRGGYALNFIEAVGLSMTVLADWRVIAIAVSFILIWAILRLVGNVRIKIPFHHQSPYDNQYYSNHSSRHTRRY